MESSLEPKACGKLGSLEESLTTRRLWWRMSQAGTQVTIITKFQMIVRPANRLKIDILARI